MGLCGQINRELIEEVLAEVILEKETTPKPNHVIRYNRSYLQSLNPNTSSTSTPPLSTNFNSLNFQKNRTNTPKGIKESQKKNHCHFCGEKGHIKNTCLKKQIYEHNKSVCFDSINSDYPTVSFYQGFLETTRRLIQLRNLDITLEELLRIRTIINTLIYFHPNESHGNKSKLY